MKQFACDLTDYYNKEVAAYLVFDTQLVNIFESVDNQYRF